MIFKVCSQYSKNVCACKELFTLPKLFVFFKMVLIFECFLKIQKLFVVPNLLKFITIIICLKVSSQNSKKNCVWKNCSLFHNCVWKVFFHLPARRPTSPPLHLPRRLPYLFYIGHEKLAKKITETCKQNFYNKVL